ncbi:MAG: alpha/beta hydrolase, partial [Brevundimonas sp.]
MRAVRGVMAALAFVAGIAAGAAQAQQAPMTPMTAPAEADAIALNTGGVAGSTGPETWFEQWGDPFVRNVTIATLTPVLPDPDKATGAAVIVAPGGGFMFLSMGNEGWEVAHALADRGVAAFVLKYRTRPTPQDAAAFEAAVNAMFSGAARPPAPSAQAAESPFADQVADATAAFALVRARASEWRVDPERIGMVGFSAGAMTTLATTLSSPSARPAFIGSIYGPLTTVEVPA